VILEHKKYDLYGKVLFEKAVIAPPFRMPTLMSNSACFLHIIEGENNTYTATGQVRMHTKESLLVKCGNYLTDMIGSPKTKKYQTVIVHLYPEVLKKIYDKDIPGFMKKPKAHSGSEVMASLHDDILPIEFIDSILFYFENPAIVSEEILVLKLKELILLLSETKNAPVVHHILSSLFSPSSYIFKEVIEAHVYSDLNQIELAQLSNQSLSSFKREFKKHYNASPAAYLRNRKMERAAELLQLSDARITDIAFDCGFNNLAHFTKCFHDTYGISPTEFRLNQNQKSLS
jgi:AraC family transcriptional regulator, exoenzyme S synthesis regulatory protein ExsA